MKTFSTIGEPIYEANHLQMKPKRSSNGPFESGFVKSANAFNSTKLLVNGSGSTRSRLSKQRPVQARDSSDGKPRIRLLEPPQKCESELERVFKVNSTDRLDINMTIKLAIVNLFYNFFLRNEHCITWITRFDITNQKTTENFSSFF